MTMSRSAKPALIVLGGFAGAGKTSLARRLSSQLGIPTLGSDAIGQTIKRSEGIGNGAIDAYRIGYDVLFGLCEEFLQSGVSVIVDTNMGWAFQWQRLDAIGKHHPEIVFLPIILRCSREISLERIGKRHAEDPANNALPELYTTGQQHAKIGEFLERLDRPDIHFVDAARPQDEVYAEIEQYLSCQIRPARR